MHACLDRQTDTCDETQHGHPNAVHTHTRTHTHAHTHTHTHTHTRDRERESARERESRHQAPLKQHISVHVNSYKNTHALTQTHTALVKDEDLTAATRWKMALGKCDHDALNAALTRVYHKGLISTRHKS